MAVQSKEVGAVVLSPWGKALAGAIAAMIANTIVYPLDLAKTRLQVQNRASEKHYSGVLDVLAKVYQKGGLRAIYSGLGGTLAGTVSTNFAYFYWYSLLRTSYIDRYSKGRVLTTATELLLGAVAGAVAQLFTIPVSVVTTRQQADDESFLDAARDVLAHDGVRGLWRGLKASLILVVNPSITYGAGSRIRHVLYGDRQYLSIWENFFLGAISKSLATVATQPLIVAKVIQQSSNRFKSFIDVLLYLTKSDGFSALFRGIGPQLSKGVLVQGLLLAFKDKVEGYIISLLLAASRRSGAPVPIKIKKVRI